MSDITVSGLSLNALRWYCEEDIYVLYYIFRSRSVLVYLESLALLLDTPSTRAEDGETPTANVRRRIEPACFARAKRRARSGPEKEEKDEKGTHAACIALSAWLEMEARDIAALPLAFASPPKTYDEEDAWSMYALPLLNERPLLLLDCNESGRQGGQRLRLDIAPRRKRRIPTASALLRIGGRIGGQRGRGILGGLRGVGAIARGGGGAHLRLVVPPQPPFLGIFADQTPGDATRAGRMIARALWAASERKRRPQRETLTLAFLDLHFSHACAVRSLGGIKTSGEGDARCSWGAV
ncbi:hypothetical protein R3P38DRAFT_3344381 [Favolaschia claudopus]|uniref:Uncharacterized protein n=1 Tax=Favolaschia claudopus TaxID=2862362 RepID=A0AAW0DJ10_9AGAR